MSEVDVTDLVLQKYAEMHSEDLKRKFEDVPPNLPPQFAETFVYMADMQCTT